MSSEVYNAAHDRMTEEQKLAMYNLYMKAIHLEDGLMVKYSDVEDTIAYHFVGVPCNKE